MTATVRELLRARLAAQRPAGACAWIKPGTCLTCRVECEHPALVGTRHHRSRCQAAGKCEGYATKREP